jgi:hypothetical protein
VNYVTGYIIVDLVSIIKLTSVKYICNICFFRPVKLLLGALFYKFEQFKERVSYCTAVTWGPQTQDRIRRNIGSTLASCIFLWTTWQVQMIPLLDYQEPRPIYLKIGSHDVEVQCNYQDRRGQTDWQPSRGFNIFSFHLPTANSIDNYDRLQIMRRTDRYNLPVSSSAVCPRINQKSA